MHLLKSFAFALPGFMALMIGTASAQSSRGLYVGLGAGVNFLSESDFDVAGPVNVENEYDAGYALSGYVGYDFGPVWSFGGVRLEGEI